MKKSILILSVCAIALAACEKVTYYDAEPVSTIEVSAAHVIFDYEGGSKTVVVASNAGWIYSTDYSSWLEVSRTDNVLTFKVGENSLSGNRQTSVTVATEDGTAAQTVTVAQVAADGTDLSAAENANCYITGTRTVCRFDATVKGNGLSTDGGPAAYVSKYGASIDKDEIVYADLLWESTPSADKTQSSEIIDGQPIYSDGYVWFTTGSSEGNALIAVKDAQGTVLWSWHIWVTDEEIEETSGAGYYWQDRNLGALSKESGTVDNKGLLYQWGRKDPFLPSYSAYGSAELANTQVGNGSGQWNYTTFSTPTASAAPGNISVTVENPMSLLLSSGSVYSWYITKSNDDNYDSFLWGDSEDLSSYTKSIFDPCPPGYNVPVDNAWSSSGSGNTWTESQYGLTWTGGGNAYYPSAGYISGTTGAPAETGVSGGYWSSGRYEETYLSALLYYDSEQFNYVYDYPSNARSVRCMRVK